jgi:DNA-binding MarR family transcriptional regulator
VEQAYARISKLALSPKQKIVITPKQEQLVELLNMEGVLNSPDIGRLLKINRARVNQLVAPLVKAGIIRQEGSARATRYSLRK